MESIWGQSNHRTQLFTDLCQSERNHRMSYSIYQQLYQFDYFQTHDYLLQYFDIADNQTGVAALYKSNSSDHTTVLLNYYDDQLPDTMEFKVNKGKFYYNAPSFTPSSIMIHMVVLEQAIISKIETNILFVSIPRSYAPIASMSDLMALLYELKAEYQLDYRAFISSEMNESSDKDKILPIALGAMGKINIKLHTNHLKDKQIKRLKQRVALLNDSLLFEQDGMVKTTIHDDELLLEVMHYRSKPKKIINELEKVLNEDTSLQMINFETLKHDFIKQYSKEKYKKFVKSNTVPNLIDKMLMKVYPKRYKHIVVLYFLKPYFPATETELTKEVKRWMKTIKKRANKLFSRNIETIPQNEQPLVLNLADFQYKLKQHEFYHNNIPGQLTKPSLKKEYLKAMHAPLLNIGPVIHSEGTYYTVNVDQIFNEIPMYIHSLIKASSDH